MLRRNIIIISIQPVLHSLLPEIYTDGASVFLMTKLVEVLYIAKFIGAHIDYQLDSKDHIYYEDKTLKLKQKYIYQIFSSL